MDNSVVQDITFLKNKPWYQRVRVSLLCGATYLCAMRGKLGYLHWRWVLFCRNVDYLLLSTSPPGDGYVTCGEKQGQMLEVWLSCLVPVCTSGARKQRQNLCLWAVLSLFNHESLVSFICSGTLPVLPERDRTKQKRGAMTRLLRG